MISNYTRPLPILLLLLSLHVTSLNAQNVGINPDGSPPDASAMLDIKNPNKGLLIPRVSLVSVTDVVTIPSPAVSLLVFNVNAGMTMGNGVGYYTWTTLAGHALEVGSGATNGNGAYLSVGGTWANASEINRKTDRSEVDGSEMLEKIKTMPAERWKYKDTNEYHIGPYAADFNSRFEVGVDDKGISTVDPSGVSLAAIKELIQIVETQNAVIADLQKRVDELEKK